MLASTTTLDTKIVPKKYQNNVVMYSIESACTPKRQPQKSVALSPLYENRTPIDYRGCNKEEIRSPTMYGCSYNTKREKNSYRRLYDEEEGSDKSFTAVKEIVPEGDEEKKRFGYWYWYYFR